MSRIRLSTPLPPKLTEWLNGVYPAWLQLPEESFHALVPFNAPQSPLRLDYPENAADLAASSIFSNLRLFLTLIGEGRVALLPDGTMTSDSLDLLLETTDWPNYDIDLTRNLERPLDQESIGPLDFLIALAIEGRLIRIEEGRIKVTDDGRRLRENVIDASIVQAVFEAAFARVNPRTLTKLAHPWVQEQAGIIFWGLSITADKPRAVSELTRYCFVPPEKFLSQWFKVLDVYMRAVYLTPMTWFGLMRTTSPQGDKTDVHERFYLKAPIFEQFMHFEIERAHPAERPN